MAQDMTAARVTAAAEATCSSSCDCWDCITDRRHSIRFALVVCAIIALSGGLFVAYEASSAFEHPDRDPDAAARFEPAPTA